MRCRRPRLPSPRSWLLRTVSRGMLRLRRALDLVGGHRSQRRVVALTSANADHLVERLHEDLAVTDLTGARRGEDRLDRRLDERLRARHLDLDLLVELQQDGLRAIALHDLALATVARDAR